METGRVEGDGRRALGGVEFAFSETGQGPPVLLIHETAAAAAIWDELVAGLAGKARTIAYDRRGWGGSSAPEGYARTTVSEQAEDAARLLDSFGAGRAAVCGAGLGAVVALDLMLRHPETLSAALLIEPPLLAFLTEATEGLSADREEISEAVRTGGAPAGLDLYLGGALPFIGAGAERIPAEVAAVARTRPLTLFAEIGAVPAWSIRPRDLAAVRIPSRLVTGTSTPTVLRRCAGELAERLGSCEPLEVECGGDLPHVGAAPRLGEELSRLG